MEGEINVLVEQFAAGQITRRQLIAQLMLLAVGLNSLAVRADEKPAPLFKAVGLNHIALRVKDVQRSRKFYQDRLGLTMMRDGGSNSCFLHCGDNFVALFRDDQQNMDHYCYSVENYDVKLAEEKLKRAAIEPEVHREAGRIYFPDPDGLKVQIAAGPGKSEITAMR